MKIKTYLILSGLLFLFSFCGKKDKQIAVEDNPSFAVQPQHENENEQKPVEKLIFRKSEDIIPSDELNLSLLKKAAVNLKVKYANVKIDETSSLRYNDNVTFFVICIVQRNKAVKTDIEDLGDFYERKYVFVNNEDGKILAEESDDNLGYYENEGTRISKTYILKDLLQLNKNTTAIAFYTEEYSNSRVVMFSEQKFSIITFDGSKIKKVLYEYPIRLTNGDSNGGGTYQIETLETGISVSDTETNGFYDLLVSKVFSYEEAAEEDLENAVEQKSDLKVKKEFQRLKNNGKEYSFKKDDRNRFL